MNTTDELIDEIMVQMGYDFPTLVDDNLFLYQTLMQRIKDCRKELTKSPVLHWLVAPRQSGKTTTCVISLGQYDLYVGNIHFSNPSLWRKSKCCSIVDFKQVAQTSPRFHNIVFDDAFGMIGPGHVNPESCNETVILALRSITKSVIVLETPSTKWLKL